jgi:hypothetical protein
MSLRENSAIIAPLVRAYFRKMARVINALGGIYHYFFEVFKS